jgi:hypothetical protein
MRVSIPILLVVMAMILFQLPAPAYSQRFLLGAKVAAQVTDTFASFPVPTTVNQDRVLFGPMAEVGVLHRFMVEINGLYKPKFNYTNVESHFLSSMTETETTTTNVSAHSWEIPFLLKYRLPKHDRIFVGGGFSARNVVGTTKTICTFSVLIGPVIPPPTIEKISSDGDIVNHWTHGPVFAVVADIPAHKVHFQPELRYTRRNAAPFPYSMHSNSVQALIGVAVGK